VKNLLIEFTLCHEIGHHVHRHRFGRDPEQEEDADSYAARIIARRSGRVILRVARGLVALYGILRRRRAGGLGNQRNGKPE
jgi:hypothetical protein